MHWKRWYKHGDPLGRLTRICSVEGCGQPHLGNGKCRKHYYQEYNQRKRSECSIEGCDHGLYARTWCQMHYQRWRKTGSLDEPVRAVPICSIGGCENAATRRGWCESHYRRWERIERHDRYTATRRAWREANIAVVRERDSRAGARRRRQKQETAAEPVDYQAILAEFGMVCHLCGHVIASWKDLNFDHVIPLARGGPHTYDNIRPAHERCNKSKGAKLPEDFMGTPLPA